MQILLSVGCTLLFLLGIVWTLFAGGFGLGNFVRDHCRILSAIAVGGLDRAIVNTR